MSQNTGRVKPGIRGSAKRFGKPTQPAKPTRPKTAREPGGSLGTVVQGIAVTGAKRTKR